MTVKHVTVHILRAHIYIQYIYILQTKPIITLRISNQNIFCRLQKLISIIKKKLENNSHNLY